VHLNPRLYPLCINRPIQDSRLTVFFTPQLLDPPSDETNPAPVSETGTTDDEDFGDEETARLAYALSICEAAVGDHRFVAAELLANRTQSGLWTDHAISALLGDLKHLGPKAVGDVIFYSLVRYGTFPWNFPVEHAPRSRSARFPFLPCLLPVLLLPP
jgi:hypothetical protein